MKSEYVSAMAKMLLVAFAIVTATTIVHESGHYVTGRLIGCENVEIVMLDEKLDTYTKMNCQPDMPGYELNALMLSGLLFVIPAALMLYFFRRDVSLLVFGFNLVISFSDFTHFGAAQYLSFTAGAILVLYGETILVSQYIRNAVVTSYSQSR